MEKIEYAVEEQHSINGWYAGGWDEIARTENRKLAETDVMNLNRRNGNHYRVREIHYGYNKAPEQNLDILLEISKRMSWGCFCEFRDTCKIKHMGCNIVCPDGGGGQIEVILSRKDEKKL